MGRQGATLGDMERHAVAPPRQLVFEVASVCNLRCPQCWIGLRWIDRGAINKFMPMDLFHKVCDEVRGCVKHVYLHLWGEPTLHPQLSEMIRRVKEFATVDLATHGLFVDEANVDDLVKCDTLSVSIDGIDQETYEKYRVGGKLERAMQGMRLLASRAPGRVNWTFVVFKHNEHQLDAAKTLARALGVNFGDKPPLFWDRAQMDSEMPTSEKHRRYTLVNGDWKLKADRLSCREFWETTYVLANGDVITCCYDGKAEWVMGNVKDSSLLDVWNGQAYTAARSNHSAGYLNAMCQEYCQLPA